MRHIDHDLEFLRRCPNEDLRMLCDFLVFDKKGNYRFSEELSDTEAFITCYPSRMQKMAAEMANELLKFGSNSVVTLFRGYPDSYEEVVRRVCKKMKTDISDTDDAVRMERLLLEKVLETAISNMSEDELRDLAHEAGIFKKDLSKQALTAALLFALRCSPQMFARIIRPIVTRLLAFLGGRAVAYTGGRALQQAVGVATGPVGWIIVTAWTIWDLASPAYRIIVPAVLQVAAMRYLSTPRIEDRRSA